MIRCPKCNATLPASYQTCQFCQTDVSAVPRPVSQAPQRKSYKVGPAPWIVPTYYSIAGYWVLSGAWTCFSASGIIAKMGNSPLVMVLGAITALIGIGLIAKIELVRGIVNVFCFLNILGGLLGLYGGLIMMAILPILGIFIIFMNVMQLATSGLMIYLIGETDDAPGF